MLCPGQDTVSLCLGLQDTSEQVSCAKSARHTSASVFHLQVCLCLFRPSASRFLCMLPPACHESNMCLVCAVWGTCISVRCLGCVVMVFGDSLPPEDVAQGLFDGGSPGRECGAGTDGRWKKYHRRLGPGLVLSLPSCLTLSVFTLGPSFLRQHPRKAHGAHTCEAASSYDKHARTHTYTVASSYTTRKTVASACVLRDLEDG